MGLNATRGRPAVEICLFCVLVGFTLWAALLARQQFLTARHIAKLSLDQQRLVKSFDQMASSAAAASGRGLDRLVGDRSLVKGQEAVAKRTRRGAETMEEPEKKSKRRNKGGQRRKKSAGAHFVAHIDRDVLLRKKAEGHGPTLGNYTAYGFMPNRGVYNIWKEEPYTNRRVFKYDKETGKVTIRREGLYLVYGQMVFNGPFSRRSYGIYINDEYTPFVETLAYEEFHRPNEPSGEDDHLHRHRRQVDTLGYTQCNTMAVTHLKKGDKVFLKSTENAKIIIPEKYLTFWGMALL